MNVAVEILTAEKEGSKNKNQRRNARESAPGTSQVLTRPTAKPYRDLLHIKSKVKCQNAFKYAQLALDVEIRISGFGGVLERHVKFHVYTPPLRVRN